MKRKHSQQSTATKPSGIDWIGDLPNDWRLATNRAVLQFSDNGKNFKEDANVLSLTVMGVKVKKDLNIGKSAVSYLGHQNVRVGNIVFTPRDFDQTPILSGVAKDSGCISNLYFVLFPKSGINAEFVNYYWWGIKYGVDYFRKFSYGMRSSFNRSQFNAIPFLIPPQETQQKIVSFLDEKTEAIDAIVEKKKKLIALLKEKRASIITHAVTKGLDPNAQMKPSGIDWIGDIPEGWDYRKLKFISKTFASNVDKNIRIGEQKVLLCNYTHVYKNEFIDKGMDFMVSSASPEQMRNFLVKNGDVLLTKDSETADDIGVPSYVAENLPEDIVCGYHLYISRPFAVVGKYLFRFFQSIPVRGKLEISSYGVTRFGLSTFPLLNLEIFFPSQEEQQKIVSYLDEKTGQIDDTIVKIERQIQLLGEYRASLIYHCVTGKTMIN